MATTNVEESSSGQMKTWVLKVSIHCKGCKKKVIKLLTGVEGVYKIDVDLKQQSVMVTGNVDADTLINKLINSGRNAQLWCQISNQKKQSNSGKPKNTDEIPTAQCEIVVGEEKEKPAPGKSPASPDAGSENPATAELSEGGGGLGAAAEINQAGDTTTDSGGEMEAVKEDKLVGDKSEVGSESKATATVTGHGEGKVSKKKKKKGQNGNDRNNNLGEQERQVESPVDAGPQKYTVTPVRANNIPPRHHLENQPSPHVYVMSYNMASTAPSYTTSYYAGSPTPNQYRYQEPERIPPPSDLESYSRQPLDSFEMFSDENPNGCSIM